MFLGHGHSPAKNLRARKITAIPPPTMSIVRALVKGDHCGHAWLRTPECRRTLSSSANRRRGYLEERNRRVLETNRKQIAEAAQRQREREEREAAEARKAQEAERAAYYAKHGWPR